MKRYLPFAIIFVVGASALTGGSLLYRAKVGELERVVTAAGAANPGAQPAHVQGPAKAAVTLEEFGDFQCPPCATVALVLREVEKEYGSKLRVIFRNFPLEMHNHAAEAARVAEAAGLQGKFWEMHEILYRSQTAWSKGADPKSAFVSYATGLGLDLARFEKDLESDAVKRRVQADQERGKSLGVNSTPTFFLNGRALPPSSLNDKSLRAAISGALRGEAPPPLSTPTPSPAVLTP